MPGENVAAGVTFQLMCTVVAVAAWEGTRRRASSSTRRDRCEKDEDHGIVPARPANEITVEGEQVGRSIRSNDKGGISREALG